MVPDDALTIEDVVGAISQCPRGGALLLVGDSNTDLVAPEGRARDKEITTAMTAAGLEYLSKHFLPQHKLCLMGWQYVVHALRSTGGAFPDQLHIGHRPVYAPERGGLGCTTQHIPLLIPGLPQKIHTYRAIALSREANMFLHQAANNPRRGQPPVF